MILGLIEKINSMFAKFACMDDLGILLVRIALGVSVAFYGVHYLLGLPESLEFPKQMLSSHGLPTWPAIFVIVGELLCPLMIIIGFMVRFSGAVVGFNFLAALVLAHADNFNKVTDFGGSVIAEPAIYMLLGFALMILGSGKYTFFNAKLR